jgi:hypothetical protein
MENTSDKEDTKTNPTDSSGLGKKTGGDSQPTSPASTGSPEPAANAKLAAGTPDTTNPVVKDVVKPAVKEPLAPVTARDDAPAPKPTKGPEPVQPAS